MSPGSFVANRYADAIVVGADDERVVAGEVDAALVEAVAHVGPLDADDGVQHLIDRSASSSRGTVAGAPSTRPPSSVSAMLDGSSTGRASTTTSSRRHQRRSRQCRRRPTLSDEARSARAPSARYQAAACLAPWRGPTPAHSGAARLSPQLISSRRLASVGIAPASLAQGRIASVLPPIPQANLAYN